MDEGGLEAVRRPGSHLDALDETLDLSSSFGQMDTTFLENVRPPHAAARGAASPAGPPATPAARGLEEMVEDIEEYDEDFVDESISASSLQVPRSLRVPAIARKVRHGPPLLARSLPTRRGRPLGTPSASTAAAAAPLRRTLRGN
eukprot:5227538-Prymnesium_polylepis.1